jgi:WD40 repeat protein
LISGGNDGVIRLWEFDKGLTFQTIETKTNSIGCLEIFNNRLYAGCGDNIFLIDLSSYTTNQILKGHTN